ncbi:MAG: KH domain-containing protein [Oscillospiraceae bacterium]|nr:KH domain-containing protein [Oscillospiraceae bacterium]
MKELLITLATGLVDDKDAVSVVVDEPNEEGVVVYHLKVAADDMGKVIGKQGRVAKAIRIIMRVAANRIGQKISVEID